MVPLSPCKLLKFGYNDLNVIMNPGQYVVNENLSKEIIAKNVVDSVLSIIEKYKAKNFLFMRVAPFNYWPVTKDADKLKAGRCLLALMPGLRNSYLILKNWVCPLQTGLVFWGIGNITSCDDLEKHFFWDSYYPEAKVYKPSGVMAIIQLEHLYNINQLH
ncbi:hypothetical protein BDF21DRAFT_405056 [Thamnidium elegans]|uniref:Uncharacterized protein n=1 Tax=Thamnidium elegans TaxID=101142 RepID=A0A8H7SKT7_9FUNG|nr:hypothetical protein INT48_002283 [Thamnidium elegans]KAI8047471.1 hypothetical protein BDF21DRAFT_405056 [Thamnidium elegans]